MTKTKPRSNNALTRVRKHFPQVRKVMDATKTITVSVRPSDTQTGRKKDPAGCALAKAAVRTKIADHAIIGIGYSWLIKGRTATRYKTSVAVGREITSFDRHQDFAPGQTYKLSKVSKACRLGHKQWPYSGPHTSHKPDTQKVHHTADIRVMA